MHSFKFCSHWFEMQTIRARYLHNLTGHLFQAAVKMFLRSGRLYEAGKPDWSGWLVFLLKNSGEIKLKVQLIKSATTSLKEEFEGISPGVNKRAPVNIPDRAVKGTENRHPRKYLKIPPFCATLFDDVIELYI